MATATIPGTTSGPGKRGSRVFAEKQNGAGSSAARPVKPFGHPRSLVGWGSLRAHFAPAAPLLERASYRGVQRTPHESPHVRLFR